MATGTQSAFLVWFAEWGQVVYFIAQIAFWVAIAAAALMAVRQYARYVSHAVGEAPKKASAVSAKPAEIDIDAFRE